MPKRTKIIVDDIRLEPPGWLVFRTAESFLKWLELNPNETIDMLSLDHDLGETVMSGYDLVHELVDNRSFPDIKRIQLHTDNPIGFKNMYMYLFNARKNGVLDKDLVLISEKMNLLDGRLSFSGYSFL